jgi:hypothetical protein
MTKFSPVHRFIVLALFVAMTVTASAQNVAPVAVDDTASTSEDISLNSTVTTNDSDVDGPAANYTLATNAANGALTLNPDGIYIRRLQIIMGLTPSPIHFVMVVYQISVIQLLCSLLSPPSMTHR